jgi:heme exporter protein CcmD
MTYVLAAYGVVIGAVGWYLVHLVRERRRLRRDLAGSMDQVSSRPFPG